MATEKQLTKSEIQEALENIGQLSFYDAMISLWSVLGYRSQRQPDIFEYGFESFKQSFSAHNEIKDIKAKGGDWEKLYLLFQVTDAELKNHFTEPVQTDLFGFKPAFQPHMQSYLFVGLQLKGETYSRTALADIARQINRCFAIPLIITFRYGNSITIAVVNRRANKKDSSRDVLEKVILIKDINLLKPHRAHLDILFELSIEALSEKVSLANFDDLHKAWAKTLDIQELNKRFYKELSNWYFWAVQNVEFPDGEESDREKRNSISIIRLLTRMIFVWFMKEKGLIPDALFDKVKLNEILKFEDFNGSSYYKAILQNLFFATLNTEMNRDVAGSRRFRKEIVGKTNPDFNIHSVFRYKNLFIDPDTVIDAYFGDIPFLNGGLFECLDYETMLADQKQYVRIDGFSDRQDNLLSVPDELFFRSTEKECDLNTIYGTKGQHYKVKGLLEILHNYKFTVSENTPVEEEVALDPELLGRVFENLLAAYNPETKSSARKATGSYYTPRLIVEYMVNESLVFYLISKQNNLTKAQKDDFEIRLRLMLAYSEDEHLFAPKECETMIEAIDACRIIDPACGSGAFLMGMLIKMVFLLHKLDPDNEKWKQQQIDKLNASIEYAKSSILSSYESVNVISSYESSIAVLKSTFNDYDDDFSRKLFLIEHCIYGSDIQPIAIHIAKLRFFISLLVDQNIDRKLHNNGIRALPNLETNLIAADSLVSIIRPKQSDFITHQIERITLDYIKQLRSMHHEHFFTLSRDKKRQIRLKEGVLRSKFALDLEDHQVEHQIAHEIADWNPYASNNYARFFDPSIMFGFDGFDIIIGNPPYVESRNSLFTDRQKDLLQYQIKVRYESDSKYVTRGSDLLTYFIVLSINLLKQNGIACMITQNSWLSTDFGVKFSRFLLKYCDVMRIIDSDYKYFDTIQINTVISMLTTEMSGSNSISFEVYKSKYDEFPEIKRCRTIKYKDSALTKNKWDLFLSDYEIIPDIELIKAKGDSFSVNRYLSVGQGLNLLAEYKYKTDELLAQGVEKEDLIPFHTSSDDAPFELISTKMCLVNEEAKSLAHLKRFSFDSTRKIPPIIALPRGLGRHYACLNRIRAYTDSNVDIYSSISLETIQLLRIWLFTNSSVFWLVRELLGRKNLGGGMLKAEAADIKGIPLYHEFQDVKAIHNVFARIKDRKALHPMLEVDTDEHLEIDRIVGCYFGFNEGKMRQIHDALKKCISRRERKSKNV